MQKEKGNRGGKKREGERERGGDHTNDQGRQTEWDRLREVDQQTNGKVMTKLCRRGWVTIRMGQEDHLQPNFANFKVARTAPHRTRPHNSIVCPHHGNPSTSVCSLFPRQKEVMSRRRSRGRNTSSVMISVRLQLSVCCIICPTRMLTATHTQRIHRLHSSLYPNNIRKGELFQFI